MYPCAGSLPSPRNVAFRVEGVQAVISRPGREVVMCGLWMLKVPANPIIHALHLLLLASLLLGTLTLTLGIDLSSKGTGSSWVSKFLSRMRYNNQDLLLPLQSEPVQHKDLGRQQ